MAANPYELQRQRIKTDSAAQGQQQNEALKRRYARMGGLNSGSYQKASERLAGQQEVNQQRATEGVDIQESAAQEAKDEAERGRTFARGERIGSQEFSAGESALGRRFATSEREGAQGFARGERLGSEGFAERQAAEGRKFTTSEREAMQGYATGERKAGEQFSRDENTRNIQFQSEQSADARRQNQNQFNSTIGMQMKQFDADELVTKFNQQIAAIQLGVPFEQMMAQIYGNKAPGGPQTTSKQKRATVGQVDFGGG